MRGTFLGTFTSSTPLTNSEGHSFNTQFNRRDDGTVDVYLAHRTSESEIKEIQFSMTAEEFAEFQTEFGANTLSWCGDDEE